jgi:hypothetical protein
MWFRVKFCILLFLSTKIINNGSKMSELVIFVDKVLEQNDKLKMIDSSSIAYLGLLPNNIHDSCINVINIKDELNNTCTNDSLQLDSSSQVKINVNKTTKKSKNRAKKCDKHLDYIAENIELALKVSEVYKIPSHFVLAIAMHESGSGTSQIARNKNNHHGIRGNKKIERWRSFRSKEEGYMFHGKIISNLLIKLYKKDKRDIDWDKITSRDIARTPYAGENNFGYGEELTNYIELYDIKQLIINFKQNKNLFFLTTTNF